jgi:hypothetical protein
LDRAASQPGDTPPLTGPGPTELAVVSTRTTRRSSVTLEEEEGKGLALPAAPPWRGARPSNRAFGPEVSLCWAKPPPDRGKDPSRLWLSAGPAAAEGAVARMDPWCEAVVLREQPEQARKGGPILLTEGCQ